MKKVFEPFTKSIREISEEVTKTKTETSNNNNRARKKISNKLPEIMNDRGTLASYLMSPLSKITNPKNTTQFQLVKDSSSIRSNDLLMKNTIPITLHDNSLTFRDTGKVFEIKGELSKKIANKNCNVDIASFSDEKLMYDFAKEMHFGVRGISTRSTRFITPMKVPKSPSLMIFASGFPDTKFLRSDPDELCNRLKLLIQKVQAGNNSDIIKEKIVFILDNLLEYKCITKKKQQKQFLVK